MKLIDLRDSTGSGDVDISTIVKVNTDNQEQTIQGLSGRKLKVCGQLEITHFSLFLSSRFLPIGQIRRETFI